MLTVSSAKGEGPHQKKSGILGMIPNWIWWWGFSSGALESVEYSFIAITIKVTLTGVVVPIKIPFMYNTIVCTIWAFITLSRWSGTKCDTMVWGWLSFMLLSLGPAPSVILCLGTVLL